MIGSTRQVTAYAYGAPVDMRKGFDGLSALVTAGLGPRPALRRLLLVRESAADPGQGADVGRHRPVHLRQATRAGRFAALWREEQAATLTLTMSELQLFLEERACSARHALARAIRAALRARNPCPHARTDD